MSNYVTYLKVKPFVAQWMRYHFGNPAVFPVGDAVNLTIRKFLTRLPPDAQPVPPEEGDVAVCIPDSKAKPVVSYNYLTPNGRKAVVEEIESIFMLNMWTELTDICGQGYRMITAIRSWCEMHGISIEHDDTLKMRYQRMRKSYLKNGVDLMKKTRNHGD